MVGEGRQGPWFRTLRQSGCAGTASVVESWTVVARGYQVAVFAQTARSSDTAARRASRPRASASSPGTRRRPRGRRGCTSRHERRRPRRRRRREEPSPQTATSAITGSARESERNERKVANRMYATAASAAGIHRQQERAPCARGRGAATSWSTARNEKLQIAIDVQRAGDRPRRGSRGAASTVTTKNGGTNASSRANRITSTRVEPRMTRNSGLPLEHGRTPAGSTPYPHSAARCANRHSIARQRHRERCCVVERPRPRGKLDRARRVEARPSALFEVAAGVVGMRPLALTREQPLDHHVVAVGELDDELAAERGEPVDELPLGNRPADHQVMDECEGEHEVRRPALRQRQPLAPAPAEPR